MSEIHALSGAYVLDALSDVERAGFERHIATCLQCRDEVASLCETAAKLADASTVAPPASLRAKILTQAAETRPLPPKVAPAPSRRWRTPNLIAAAAAVVALLGGITATAWQPWQSEYTQLTVADRIRTAADARTWTARLPHGGKVTVTRSVSVGAVVWSSSGLGPAPKGHVYEVWIQTPDETLQPAELMSSGDGEAVLRGEAVTAIGAGMTIEPAGGSEAPTTKPLAFLDLRAQT